MQIPKGEKLLKKIYELSLQWIALQIITYKLLLFLFLYQNVKTYSVFYIFLYPKA